LKSWFVDLRQSRLTLKYNWTNCIPHCGLGLFLSKPRSGNCRMERSSILEIRAWILWISQCILTSIAMSISNSSLKWAAGEIRPPFSSAIASHARGESICQVELALKAKGIVGKFVAQGRPSTKQLRKQ
jgi:hypothetical protein